jgi:hypothetical protein
MVSSNIESAKKNLPWQVHLCVLFSSTKAWCTMWIGVCKNNVQGQFIVASHSLIQG